MLLHINTKQSRHTHWNSIHAESLEFEFSEQSFVAEWDKQVVVFLEMLELLRGTRVCAFFHLLLSFCHSDAWCMNRLDREMFMVTYVMYELDAVLYRVFGGPSVLNGELTVNRFRFSFYAITYFYSLFHFNPFTDYGHVHGIFWGFVRKWILNRFFLSLLGRSTMEFSISKSSVQFLLFKNKARKPWKPLGRFCLDLMAEL